MTRNVAWVVSLCAQQDGPGSQVPLCPPPPAACLFPARGRDLTRFASVERACPLCEAALEVHAVKRIFDPIAHMRRTVFAGLVPAGERGSGSGQAAQ